MARWEKTLEVIDGVAREAIIPPLTTVNGTNIGWLAERNSFLWDGDPAEVHSKRNSVEVYRFQNQAWKSAGFLAIPKPRREVTWNFGKGEYKGVKAPTIHVRSSGNEIHLFVNVDGRLLHKKGLEFDPEILNEADYRKEISRANLDSDQPISALRPVNTDFDLIGWSRVREKQNSELIILPIRRATWDETDHGLMVDGQPAALLIDDVASNRPVCHLCRFDGANWSEMASEPLPFGSRRFRTFTANDGQRSYLHVMTSTGSQDYVYAVEAGGLRMTRGASKVRNAAAMRLIDNGVLWLVAAGLRNHSRRHDCAIHVVFHEARL